MSQNIFHVKTNLPVQTDGEETEAFIAVTPAKHSRNRFAVRGSKADDRDASKKREYPFWKELPNKNAGKFQTSTQ